MVEANNRSEPRPVGPLVCGIDLGSKRDHTAIILLEQQKRLKGGEGERLGFDQADNELVGRILRAGNYEGQAINRENHYVARRTERLPLGTAYPKVVKYLRGLDDQISRMLVAKGQPQRPITYVVDATGIGGPVVGYLADEIDSERVQGVYITAGLEARFAPHELYIPKQHLVSMLQILLQSGRIHLSETEDMTVMKEELKNYELKMQPSGQLELGALKTGQHDDLVTALGLGVYYGEEHVREIPLVAPIRVGRNTRWPSGFGHGKGLRRLKWM
ncbi:MAG: hypothetical protein ACXV4B_07700 [Halobacteriota archaeon]